MNESNGQVKHKLVATRSIPHPGTGLIVAISDDMQGLYVHARSQADLLERTPVAIRDILEADGYRVLDLSKAGSPAEAGAGFVPALRRFQASLALREPA
jgi:hypothetical protein